MLSSSGSLTGAAVPSRTVSMLFASWIQPCVGKEGREPFFLFLCHTADGTFRQTQEEPR